MQLFIQQLINGVMLGSMFALMSLGLSLMFGIMKTANFGYGALYMIGGYVAFWSFQLLHFSYIYATILAFVVMFLAGAFIEWIGFRRFRGNEDATLIFGLGIAMVAKGLAIIYWGSQTRFISNSGAFSAKKIGPFILPESRLWASIASIVLVGLVYLIVKRSRWGGQVRAVADNAERAQLLGVNTNVQYMFVAGLATGLSAIACVFLIPVFSLSPAVDDSALYTAMTVVILGGLGNIAGCAVGGMILGIVTALAFGYVNSTIAPLFPLMLLILVLAFKPEGLFGSRERVA